MRSRRRCLGLESGVEFAWGADIRIRGSHLTLDGYEKALGDHEAPDLEVDLSVTEFVDPLGIAGIAAAVAGAVTRGTQVSITPPRRQSCANYLSRMHFPALLDSCDIAHGFPQVREADLRNNLVELVRFDDETHVDKLARLVFRRLDGNGAAPGVASEVFETLSEIGANAAEHSRTTDTFMIAQVYNRGGTNVVDLAVSDSGIGVAESLRRADYECEDDHEGLRLAMVSEVSASREAGRGNGLPDMCEIVLDLGGRFTLRSGSARIDHGPGTSNGPLDVVSQPGTIMAASIPC